MFSFFFLLSFASSLARLSSFSVLFFFLVIEDTQCFEYKSETKGNEREKTSIYHFFRFQVSSFGFLVGISLAAFFCVSLSNSVCFIISTAQ